MPPPKIYMGTGTFGGKWPKEKLEELVRALKELGIRKIDTSPDFPIESPQQAERLVGELGFAERGFLIDSKISYIAYGDGALKPDAIQRSLDRSLENVRAKKLYTFYCHGQDRTTPIAEQAAALDAEYRKGKFARLGLYNIEIDRFEEWLRISEERGFVKPSVFQGQHHVLFRGYEETLFPLLRKHKVAFIAWSPISGGYLTGKPASATNPEDVKAMRFEVGDPLHIGAAIKRWCDKDSVCVAADEMAELCEVHDIKLIEAMCRWALYHSILDGGPVLSREQGDAIIICPDDLYGLGKYAELYAMGPLPDQLARDFDDMWPSVKEDITSAFS